MICIGIAAMLLSLTAGMFLLAKTNKDNLGAFFKVISWAVIVISMLAIVCCAVCCVAGKCHKKRHCRDKERMENCRMDEGCEQGMPGMHKRMMIMKMNHGGNMEQCEGMGKCEEGQMNCAGEGMMNDCCKGGMKGDCCKATMDCCKMKGEGACIEKVEIKKDTVIVKKK